MSMYASILISKNSAFCHNGHLMPRTTPLAGREAEICRRLHQARLDTRLARTILAKDLGIDSSSLANYEHGRTRLRFDDGIKACTLLNVTLWWLSDGADPRRWPWSIQAALRGQIPPRMLFSEAYDRFLRAFLEPQRALAEKLTTGLAEGGREG